MATSETTFFVGEFTHALDAKGRVTIPSKWRIQGGENTYLALPNPGGYITVYPPKMIERLEGKVAEASLSDPQAQSLLMELFSKADSFGCDKQGEDQSQRQASRPRWYKREGGSCGEVFLFCNLVGGSA